MKCLVLVEHDGRRHDLRHAGGWKKFVGPLLEEHGTGVLIDKERLRRSRLECRLALLRLSVGRHEQTNCRSEYGHEPHGRKAGKARDRKRPARR